MEHDYKSEIEKPEAGHAVFQAMNIRAEVEYEFQDKPKGIKIYDEIVSLFETHRHEYASYLPVIEQVAKALVNKGTRLAWIEQTDKAIAVYDDLVARFGSCEETPVAEKVISSLYNKSVTMSQTGRSDESIMVYDDLVARYGCREETSIAEKVARAMVSKGITMVKMGQSDEAITLLKNVINKFASHQDPEIVKSITVAAELIDAMNIQKRAGR